MKVGDTILPWQRNSGASYGLQYPYIFGFAERSERWIVWHRHTGKVIYVCAPQYGHHGRQLFLEEHMARQRSREFNNISDDPVEQARVNILHDMEA